MRETTSNPLATTDDRAAALATEGGGRGAGPERIAIVGGGIAGLACALAMQEAAGDRQIELFERDEVDTALDPEAAFASWRRPGVSHLRHSHVFLARLYNLIRDRYPDLLRELLAAGCRELRFAEGLPPALRARYVPRREDDDFTILSSRRTTLELVMRRFVERRGGVRFHPGRTIRGVRLEPGPEGIARVAALRWSKAGEAAGDAQLHEQEFDVVVDASGKSTRFPAWLGEQGVRSEQQSAPAGILYFTRHYRLLEGRCEPTRGDLPGNGDLGYFKFGIFPADGGNFSVTVALPEEEVALRRAVQTTEGFDTACRACPGAARWIEADRAEPVSKVYGMGGLESRWISYRSEDGRPSVLGFFAVGDSAIRTNPLYGRGCSSGALQAHLLAEVLAEVGDPVLRAVRYAAAQEDEIRPHYRSMARQDREAIRRAARLREGGTMRGLRQRLRRSFVEDGVLVASRGSLTVLRALMRGFHMLEDPALALGDPRILLRVLSFWVRPEWARQPLRAPPARPARHATFALLGPSPG